MRYAIALLLILSAALFGCAQDNRIEPPSRQSAIPPDAIKMTMASDSYPPKLHSTLWEEPVPAPGLVNTAGAEDSPFVTPDGDTLYFFFTPDVRVPAERQLLDNVTGIYVATMQGGAWSEPKRVVLQDPGKLSLDGCEFIQDDTMWFCSAREGYSGVHWFTARNTGGKWQDWKDSDFDPFFKVGELHLTSDGQEVYFHSDRPGGKGGLDIWMSRKSADGWQEPEDVAAVNSAGDEGWPFISQDGRELWFLRTYLGSPAIFYSKKENGSWSEPELIISQFAGEPSLDNQGNIYFVHHHYKEGKMIEADIYVAYKKNASVH